MGVVQELIENNVLVLDVFEDVMIESTPLGSFVL